MYYRMSRLHFEEEQFEDLISWAESVRSSVRSIDGLLFADVVRTGSGEGMLLAGYRSESDFESASDTVADLIDQMSAYLTDNPHVHAGSTEFSFLE